MLVSLMIFSVLFVYLVSSKYNEFVIRKIDKGPEGPLAFQNLTVVRWAQVIGILLYIIPGGVFIFSYVKSICIKNVVGIIIGSAVILILIISNVSIIKKRRTFIGKYRNK